MALKFTIRSEGTGLCRSCRHNQRIVFDSGRERNFCTDLPMSVWTGQTGTEIFGKVVECNVYDERAKIDKYGMEKIAYVINIDPKTKNIGFLRPGTKEHADAIKAEY